MNAHAHPATPLTPEEVALANWLSDPEAKDILRSCILAAPEFEDHSQAYTLTRDDWSVPVGARAERLHEIWGRYSDRVSAHCNATGEWAASFAFHAIPRWDQAIEQVCAAAGSIQRIWRAGTVVEMRRAA